MSVLRSVSTYLKTIPSGETFKAVVLAAPGGHESEIAKKISIACKLKYISAEEKIYENIRKKTKIGKMVQTFKAAGMAISDEVMVRLVNEELENLNRISWVLSGFPLTVNQAKMFWDRHKLQMAISVAFPQHYILMNLIQQYKNEQTEEAMTFTVSHVDKVINRHKAAINPVLKFYESVGVLHTFREKTLDLMWGKMRRTLKDRMVSKPLEK